MRPQDDTEIKDDKTEKDIQRTEDDTVSLRTIIRERALKDDITPTKNITFKKIIGGDFLNNKFLRKQIWLILLITGFLIVYISNRYKCQQSLIRINELKSELKDAKYRALSSGSELTQKTRESKVLDILRESKDSTLHIPTQPPYIVNVKEETQQ